MLPIVHLVRLENDPSPSQPVTLELTRKNTLVGSGAECDCLLPATHCERRHCVILREPGAVRLCDLNSRQGVRVNDEQVEFTQLHSRDVVEIGTLRFEVHITEDSTESNDISLDELQECSDFQSASLDEPTKVGSGPQNSLDVPLAQIASDLVQQNVINEFQANWLIEGRFPAFDLDGHRVTEILGAGGMGWLYMGQEAGSKTRVALKVLSKPEEAQLRVRMELEAQAGMKLDHPGIVKTRSLTQKEGLCFLVMDFVEGITLHELIEFQGPLPWSQVCDVMWQLSDALDHMHQLGMVHRDIKPANVLLEKDGTVKLLDFGLALVNRAADEDEFSLAMIFGQNCIGTPDYMSPEQAADSFSVDGRADLYGLGGTLFSALTGRVLYAGATNEEKWTAHRDRPVPSMERLIPGLPAGVALILERLLAKTPGERYASAGELMKAAKPYARRHPVQFDFYNVLFRRRGAIRSRLIRTHLEQQQRQDSLPPALDSSSPVKPMMISSAGPSSTPSTNPDSSFTSVSLQPPEAAAYLSPEEFSPTDNGLRQVMESWENLPPETREKILALIQLQ